MRRWLSILHCCTLWLTLAIGPSAQATPPGLPAALSELLTLALTDTDGQTHRLADLHGSVVVVNFWASWCPPCIKEMPMLAAASRTHAASGVRVIGIGIDRRDNILRIQQERNIPYPLWLGSAQALNLTRSLGNGAQGLPFTLLLDREGRLRATRLGLLDEAELARWLTLAEHSP